MKKTILLDESILFILIFPTSYRIKIYRHLSELLTDNYQFVTTLYTFLRIQNIFIKEKKIHKFFDFFRDCSNLFSIIYPIEVETYEHTFYYYEKIQDMELAFSIQLSKEKHIQYIYSAKIDDSKKEVIEKEFGIHIIYPSF